MADLSEVLEPAVQRRSLLELSIQEGFEGNRHGTGAIVLSVDARYVVHIHYTSL